MNSNKGQELANLLISKLKLVDLDSKLTHEKWSSGLMWLSNFPGEFNDIVLNAFEQFQSMYYVLILLLLFHILSKILDSTFTLALWFN